MHFRGQLFQDAVAEFCGMGVQLESQQSSIFDAFCCLYIFDYWAAWKEEKKEEKDDTPAHQNMKWSKDMR